MPIYRILESYILWTHIKASSLPTHGAGFSGGDQQHNIKKRTVHLSPPPLSLSHTQAHPSTRPPQPARHWAFSSSSHHTPHVYNMNLHYILCDVDSVNHVSDAFWSLIYNNGNQMPRGRPGRRRLCIYTTLT